MKVNKPITLHVPESLYLSLGKYLESNKPTFKYEVLYFYFIIHHIMSKLLKTDEKGVPIGKSAKSIIGSKTSEYVKYLKNGEFIISDNICIPQKKSYWYKINEDYLVGTTIIMVQTSHKLFTKIIENQRSKKAHYNRLEPFLKTMYKEFMSVQFDYDNARKWIEMQPDETKRNSYNIAITQMEDPRFRYFKRNKTNKRLDTNLTNLKKDIKEYIIGDYINIDLKNAQPFFFSILIKQIIGKEIEDYAQCSCLSFSNLTKTFGIKCLNGVSLIHHNHESAFLVELSSFFDSVVSGLLYDDFVLRYGKGMDRDKVKDIMFCVFFSKNSRHDQFKSFIPYLPEKKIFASVYPLVYEVIKMFKTRDNRLLAIFLQCLESYIFIDCVAPCLVANGIIPLTVHDSFIVKSEFQEKALEILHQVFMEKFGIVPTFSMTPIGIKGRTRQILTF